MVGILNSKAVSLLDSLVDDVDASSAVSFGLLRIYSGSGPAPDANPTGTLLATLTFQQPAFDGATDDAPGATVDRAGSISSDTSAVAGTAGYARAVDRAATPLTVMQYTVGESSEEIVFNSATFTTGATVSVSALTVTLPET